MKVTQKGQNDLGRTRVELEAKKRTLIEQMFPKGGDRKSEKSNSETTSLIDYGITYDESSDAKVIKEEEEIVKEVMDEIEQSNEIIEPKKVASKVRKKKKEQEKKEAAKVGETKKIDVDFRYGDFEEVFKDIPDGSVDCIITDPPYPYEYIECWTKLSRFAKRVLKPHGYCIAYSGQMHLPEVMKRMGEHLNYYWMFTLIHTGSRQLINGRNLFCGWKPLLIYQNGFKRFEAATDDFIMGTGKEKTEHRWQQAKDELKPIIEHFTKKGDLIVEPFAGGGTTIIAARELGRDIKAAEIDFETYNIAKNRL